MAETTEPVTLYDKFQKTLSSPPDQEKSSKGRLNKLVNIFKPAGNDASSNNKDQKPNDVSAAAGSNGDIATQNNNTGEGSSSKKKKIPKTYEVPLKVRGFEYDEMSLEIMLLHGDSLIKTIGVVGLPGVGKTTLCWSILNNERVKGSYVGGQMIWISLSEKTKTEEEPVGGIIDHYSDEHQLPVLLDDLILKSKLKEKYIIVVDDVEEGEEDSCYEILKNFFNNKLPKDKGGAVIVTCRSEEVAKKMVGDKNLHRLQPLSDPTSCWLIYRDALRGSATEEKINVSQDVMEELMKKCGGLPAAAQMMGKIKAQKLLEEKKRLEEKEKEKHEEKKKANQKKSTIQSSEIMN
ncbi:hypothetical protein REPUB_Repub08aG0233700 [Reevesia pubescens]